MAVINNEKSTPNTGIMGYISNDIGIFDKYIVYCSDYNYNQSTYVLVKSSFGSSGYTVNTYNYNSSDGTISKSTTESESAFPSVSFPYYCYSNISGNGRAYTLPYTGELSTIALWFIGLTILIGVLISCLFRKRRG